VLGAEVVHHELVESDGVEEALVGVAESYVQLLSPTREDSLVARFLATRGEGLHHVGYRVADCAEALDAVKRAGGVVLDEAPRPGSRGTMVAFVHPRSSFGTLIELVQENRPGGAGDEAKGGAGDEAKGAAGDESADEKAGTGPH